VNPECYFIIFESDKKNHWRHAARLYHFPIAFVLDLLLANDGILDFILLTSSSIKPPMAAKMCDQSAEDEHQQAV
jgi:hypothetical protein